MTPEERRMLSDLADKIAQTPAPPKDAEAEEFIRSRIGSRPDALYLMTQTVLIQNMAIEQAQHQIQELKQQSPQVAPPSAGGSFLGTQMRPQPGAPAYGSGQYAPPPPPPQYAPPSPGGPSPGGGAPSFLRGAAQTAAGVAAGALAFEGIRSLFSHPGYGGAGVGGFGGSPIEETVVNNYYDAPPHEAGQQFADSNDSSLGQDADYDDTQSNDGQVQDVDYDSGDDSGGFDGGGSDDNFA
jgi:uncharacterized protein